MLVINLATFWNL